MSDAVFLARNGQQQGPYTHAQLTAMAQRGEILAGDLAWYEGLLGWREAGPVLQGLGIAPAPASPPPLPDCAPAVAAEKMNRRQEYEAFIGPQKSAYYVPVFEHFDAGRGAIRWNWPAALITSYWMLYRGMLLWGFLWYPILGYIASFVMMWVANAALGPAGVALCWPVYLICSIVVMGLYGNKLFHGHVLKQIRRSSGLGLSEPQRRDWLIRRGASSYLWVLIVIVIAFVGMLAAIAIPAYQDYTIRAQVSEGAVLADGVKPVVAEYYGNRNAYPADNAAAGLPDPAQVHGQYAQRVQVDNGVITVTYGGSANRLITGKVLTYVPQDTGHGSIEWRCNTERTDLPDKWLPRVCRK